MESIKERIKNVMSIIFELPVGDIDDDASPDSIATWDSLRHLNLILALEEEFGVSLRTRRWEICLILNY